MASKTEASLEAFADNTGIHPADGGNDSELKYAQDMALELIRAIERERAGIRDGDGYWHGSDPVSALAHEINAAVKRVREATE